jgi:HEAT repeat protein
MVAVSLAKQLEADHSDELKAFICRQLQLCGRAEEVSALAKLLESERLCEPATQALLAIDAPQATAALRSALAGAKGVRRMTIVKALGRQRDQASAAAVRPDAADPDPEMRLVALYALANMGDAGAADVLLKAAEAKSPYERSQAVEACLLLARRLGEQGRAKDAENVYRRLLGGSKSPEQVHVRSAALDGLAELLGAGALPDVMAALESDEPDYRVPAARTAVRLAPALDKSQATELAKAVLEATEEEAVLQQAQAMLPEPPKTDADN